MIPYVIRTPTVDGGIIEQTVYEERDPAISKGAIFDPEAPPRRLSMDPASPHYRPFDQTKKVGVRFKGVEKKNVYEYDADEGWVRLLTGTRGTDRQGKPFTVKLQGRVEPYWRTT